MGDSEGVTSKEIVRRALIGLLVEGDLSLLDELIAKDFVGHGDLGDVTGREAIEHYVNLLRKAFSKTEFQIDDMVAEGDKVAVRWTLRGLHNGEILGVAPTGRNVFLQGMSIMRVRDGQIAERWNVTNQLALMNQLKETD